MKCSEVMTKNPTCCTPSDTAQDAAKAMKQVDAGPIPVVRSRDSKELVGIVTDRDLAMRVVAEGKDPKATKLEDVMSRDVSTCMEDDDVSKAARLMEQFQIRRVPIVKADGTVIGIIAQADVAIRVDKPKLTAEVVEQISH